MKVRASVKKRSTDCKIVRRKGQGLYYQQKEPQTKTKTRIRIVNNNINNNNIVIYGQNCWY